MLLQKTSSVAEKAPENDGLFVCEVLSECDCVAESLPEAELDNVTEAECESEFDSEEDGDEEPEAVEDGDGDCECVRVHERRESVAADREIVENVNDGVAVDVACSDTVGVAEVPVEEADSDGITVFVADAVELAVLEGENVVVADTLREPVGELDRENVSDGMLDSDAVEEVECVE